MVIMLPMFVYSRCRTTPHLPLQLMPYLSYHNLLDLGSTSWKSVESLAKWQLHEWIQLSCAFDEEYCPSQRSLVRSSVYPD